MTPVVASEPMLAGPRYPELDRHRGLAVLAITIFTVYQFCQTAHGLYRGTLAYPVLSSLDAGVPWFFVVTAFLLFEPIARAVIDGRPLPLVREFLGRRIAHLVPLYYLAVLVVWFTRQQALPGDWHDLLEHLTFTQVFDTKRIFYTDGPAWAVSVMAYFFLALAALTTAFERICRRLSTRRQRIAVLAGAAGALALISVLWKVWSYAAEHRSPSTSATTWYGPLANLDNFAAGMSVAVLAAAFGIGRQLPTRSRLLLRVGGVAILIAAFSLRMSGGWPAVFFSTECSLGFACLVAAAVSAPAADSPHSAAIFRPLAGLGTISYGVYLWHEPILLALNNWHGAIRQTPGAFLPDTAVVITASILAGWLSYILIERPIRRLALFLRSEH